MGFSIILLIRLPLHPLRLLRIKPPKDAERTKIDFIIRSWIFSTLAPSLRKRLVDLNPTTAKDAWTYIEAIFQDNKRPRAMALKAELRNLKLGDLSINGGSISDGVTTAGGPLYTVGGSDAFWSTAGGSLVLGPSQPPVQFIARGQQQQGGSFPGSVHLGQSPSMPFHPSQLFASGLQGSGQATLLPNAFNTTTLQEPASGNWNMDIGASSHLNDSVHCLSDILNMCIYPSVTVGGGIFIPLLTLALVFCLPFRPLRFQ
ncbi:hypothetical protein Tco_0179748 [Tanacetum coccineum]